MNKNFTIKNLIRIICFICLSLAIFLVILFSQVQGQSNSLINSYPNNSDVNIVIIQHDSCPWSYFWCVVENGINDAAKDLNVNVEIKRPIRLLKENKKKIVEKHIGFLKEVSQGNGKQPDAVGITLIQKEKNDEEKNDEEENDEEENDEEVIEYLKGLMDKKIPIIVYNSDLQVVKKLNEELPEQLRYIGQDDYQAGYEAGKELAKEIKEKGRAVCINDAPEAINIQNRCKGFEKAIDEAKAKDIEYKNLETIPNNIFDDLIKDFKENYEKDSNENKNFQTIYLSLGPKGAEPFYKFIECVKKINDQKCDNLEENEYDEDFLFAHGIFDLSKRIIDNINNENTLFAIDQQPYIQGYMIVQSLFWKVKYKLELQNKIEDTKIQEIKIQEIKTCIDEAKLKDKIDDTKIQEIKTCIDEAELKYKVDETTKMISTGPILVKKDENKLEEIEELLAKYR